MKFKISSPDATPPGTEPDLRRFGNQFNELGLRRQATPLLGDQEHLLPHVLAILRSAALEFAAAQITVSQRQDRVWVSFARVLDSILAARPLPVV